ncbi:ino80 chromatin remodeling complex [Apiospora phragmitis]|uniref:Ino80 chromatin remodeling complex n=1 Tax=Apiospora phragmitis TaxID=2905665 RepID=A0ABR1SR98_9PEZI
MAPEEEDQENIDPQTEIDFGREKQAHRANIIAADAHTRSAPLPRALARLAGASRRGVGSLNYQIFEASSPAGPGSGALDSVVPRKPRLPTAHQLAVEHNRNKRVEYILDRGLRKAQHKARKSRR